jgi:aminoglycoside phosphotransferase (APT) family kinase protein
MNATAPLERTRSASAAAGLVDVLPSHRFDEARLWRYLADHLEGFAEPAELQQFQGGQSNPTFLISSAGRRCVLRKKPPGQLLPSAHQVEREYRVMRALQSQGVPVPNARLLCEDASVIGTAFYVMDYVPGRLFSDVSLPRLDRAERHALYQDFGRVLATIHCVDWRAAGLGDYGKPVRYVARQLDRWTRQYLASKTDENAAMDRLIEWLQAHAPTADETTVVHGDFRFGNLIIDPCEPRIIAVLDWELSTLGHPLGDLAYACMLYHFPEDPMVSGLAGRDLAALGIPTETQLVETYCRHAGRDVPRDLRFFLAFSFFRSVAIAQGVYARALQGNAADRRGIEHGRVAKVAAEIGWEIAHGTS